MKISLILTTARLGGFDCLDGSVKQQTMPREDFEVLVVDEWYEKRKWIEAVFRGNSPQINYLHLPPKRKSRIYDNSSGFNAALAVASGELVVFLVDFCWLYPDYLKDHWEFYSANPGYSMSSFVDRYAFPPLQDNLTIEKNYWTIFRQEFDDTFGQKWFVNNEPVYRERRGDWRLILNGDGMIEMPGDKVYLLGDSIPLRILREINGLDEAYDGGYGSNDCDAGTRAIMAGWKFGLNPGSIIQKLGTPDLSARIPAVEKLKVRSPEDNYRMFQRRITAIREGKETLTVPDGRGAWS